MIVGIGLDLVELSRVARSLERWGDHFVDKLMDPEEAGRLPGPPAERVFAVSAAVALKEAASKALGTGWSNGVRWRDVVADPGPPPTVTLVGPAAEVAARRGSAGEMTVLLESRGDLLLAEVWLLR